MGYLGSFCFRLAISVTVFGNSVPVHNLPVLSSRSLSTIGQDSVEGATIGRHDVSLWGFGGLGSVERPSFRWVGAIVTSFLTHRMPPRFPSFLWVSPGG